MPEIEIIQNDILSDKIYRLELIRLQKTKDGKTETQEREVYFRPDSAAILLFDPERKTVLLTKQFRLPVHLIGKKDLLVEACAGILDQGELPEHAIIREVEEETGYRISEIRKIAEGFMTPASVTEYVYFFTGKYSPEMKVSEGGGKAEEGEDIRLIEIPAAEARELVLAGKIYDVKTIVLLQHAIIQNLI
ncbi:NUDIX domain-containing protein [Pedobacter sp. P351]|uniref:NUDIX domain-containing protein n=1 Tax=Pedobacter superstes TaxID=3133441 RepID=UPI0030A3A16D